MYKNHLPAYLNISCKNHRGKTGDFFVKTRYNPSSITDFE